MDERPLPAGEILGRLIDRVVPLIRQDAELLSSLRTVAERFLALTESPANLSVAADVLPIKPVLSVSDLSATNGAADVNYSTATISSNGPSLPAVNAPQAPVSPLHVALPSSPGIEIPARFRRLLAAESDLELIETRCKLKADGARWAAARERSLRDGADFYTEIEPKDRELIAAAKNLEDCFLWMNHSSAPIPDDLQLWEDVAGCFEASAMSVALLRQVIENGESYRGFLEKAMDLTAEAQSALRMSVARVDGKPDSDQHRIFQWIRQTVTEEHIFVARYMRLDDPADPTGWNDLQERIGRLEAEIDEIRQKDKNRVKLLKKAQYHARLLAAGKGAEADWKKVIDAVDALVADGMPPSNTDVRDLLAPIIEELPEFEDVPQGFQRVLAEVDRFLATHSPAAKPVAREISPEVRKVADLYQGKTMAIIGGDRRPHAYDALKSSFCLKELIWIETRDHESTDIFVPYIARADIDVVLLAIRWSSHSYGDVKALCDRFGKEFYRLPAGYNPNRVAHQILQHRGV
jgi:hypothetical protein